MRGVPLRATRARIAGKQGHDIVYFVVGEVRELLAEIDRLREERVVKADTDAEALARRFHETYERLAPDFGYQTREASRKPWEEVPEQNRNLMIAVCAELSGDTPA